MTDQIVSWATLLTIVGLVGFYFAGKKKWWCWYINIGCQVLWFTYAIVSEQYAFILASIAYTWVFTKNAIAWTREHRQSPVIHNPKYDVKLLFDGTQFDEEKQKSRELIMKMDNLSQADVLAEETKKALNKYQSKPRRDGR